MPCSDVHAASMMLFTYISLLTVNSILFFLRLKLSNVISKISHMTAVLYFLWTVSIVKCKWQHGDLTVNPVNFLCNNYTVSTHKML